MKKEGSLFSYPLPLIIWIVVFVSILLGFLVGGLGIEKVRRLKSKARTMRSVRRTKKQTGDTPGGNIEFSIECSATP